MDQGKHPGTIADLNPCFLGEVCFSIHQSGAASPGFEGQSTPKLETSFMLESLPSVNRHETDSVFLKPDHGFPGLGDQGFTEIRVRPETRQTIHVIKKLVG